MKVKKSTFNYIVVFWGVVIVFGFILILSLKPADSSGSSNAGSSVKIENGKQVVDITARGGYSPDYIKLKANTETILRMITQNSFDCSTAIIIPQLGISKTLPFTGKTDIPIAAQNPGTKINGTCTMGMYRFTLEFI